MFQEAARQAQVALPSDDAVLVQALLGGGLPPAAERHLAQASLAYDQDDVAEIHLRLAEAEAPDHAAVLIGLYRFYFYKGRLAEALEVARTCLAKSARENGFAPDWRHVQPGDADFSNYDDMVVRFFLFTLKGYAYLHMRLGDVEEGRAAILKLLALDPSDKIGAGVLLSVIERMGQDDDE